jgi:hypothetical protein
VIRETIVSTWQGSRYFTNDATGILTIA